MDGVIPTDQQNYSVCLENGLEYFKPAVCETMHYLSIPLYTNIWSEVFRTLFETHIVAGWFALYMYIKKKVFYSKDKQ